MNVIDSCSGTHSGVISMFTVFVNAMVELDFDLVAFLRQFLAPGMDWMWMVKDALQKALFGKFQTFMTIF